MRGGGAARGDRSNLARSSSAVTLGRRRDGASLKQVLSKRGQPGRYRVRAEDHRVLSLTRTARNAGFTTVVVGDVHCTDQETLLDHFVTALQLPEWPPCSWDELMLTLHELDDPVAIVWDRPDVLVEADPECWATVGGSPDEGIIEDGSRWVVLAVSPPALPDTTDL